MTSVANYNLQSIQNPPLIKGGILDSARLTFFDYFACAVSILTLVSSNYWKVQGPLILLSFVVFSALYMLYCSLKHKIFYRSKILFLFTILGIIYLLLSIYRLLPGEPEFFMSDYVLRMGYFVVAIYPITGMFYALFCNLRRANMLRNFAMFGSVSTFIAALVLYSLPPYDGYWLIEGGDLNFIDSFYSNLNYTITNLSILFLWSNLFLLKDSKYYFLVFIAFLATSASAQMLIFSLICVVIWFSRNPIATMKPLSYLVVFGFPLGAILMVIFGQQFGIDPNTIHRAKWWTEALAATLQNGGIGLGFGADSTTDFIVADRFQMLGKWGQLPIHVIHNDFVYSFYSMGVIGGILVLLFHFNSLSPVNVWVVNLDKHLAMMFLTVCLTTSVNSAFVSPTIFVGLCFIYGYLESFRKTSNWNELSQT